MNDISLKINGQTVSCKEGDRLIDVALKQGDYIPRFCYHPNLSVVASCRMCLVEIEGCGKSQPACATVVREGMVVRTQSQKVISDQKAIMQFLLVNHPLHCPICDQGGECDLQDVAMGYGIGASDSMMEKRTVKDEDLGPLVATDMSLCIHCTRCVRFGTEIAGIPDLGLMGTSDRASIGTYLSKGLRSELSGNMIDLCPVGALTSKPAKFTGRSWSFTRVAGVSPHDCFGSNLYYHIIPKGYAHLSKVMRVVPKDNPALNDIWLSDRDRFSYEGIHSSSRLLHPKIKKNNKWVDVEWEEALSAVVTKLQSFSEEDKRHTGVCLSKQATMEEGFIAQQLFRELGIENIDYRVDDMSRGDFLKPCSVTKDDFYTYDSIVLIGCNIRYEQPLMAKWIKDAVSQGTSVLSIGAVEYNYAFKHDVLKVAPQVLASSVFEALSEEKGHAWIQGKKVLFLLGQEVFTHPLSHEIETIVASACENNSNDFCLLTKGPNALGLKAMKCLPKKKAMGFQEMLTKKMKCMWLQQLDMEDILHMDKAKPLLESAFVIAMTSYDTESLKEVADIMLPLALPAETEGSYVNYQGTVQSFSAAVRMAVGIRKGWSIYAVLAALMGKKSIDYDALHQRVNSHYHQMVWKQPVLNKIQKPKDLTCEWVTLGLTSWVRGDAQVRHANALQKAYPKANCKVHPKGYKQWQKLPNIESCEQVAFGVLLVEGLTFKEGEE